MNDRKLKEDDLQAAIRKFLASGGMIKKLPDQKDIIGRRVGMKYNASEIAGELNH